MKYSIKEIANILHLPTGNLADEKAGVSYLLTDSRSLTFPEDTLFFAIRTNSNDGHSYIASLYERGVRNFVVDNVYGVPSVFNDANFLVVKSPVAALQSIATYHRRRFNIPVIGITGSRGKASVKEWLYQLLKDDYNIVRSPRNFDSQIGVPLSLWEIDDNTTLAIVEAGISQASEMQALQAMIRPTIGIFTNLSEEHDDGFSSRKQKASEKAALLTACECIIYNADDEIISETVEPILSVAQEVAWSSKNAEASFFISEIEKNDGHTHISYSYMGVPADLEIPFVNDYDIENVINCVAVMIYMHIRPEIIAQRVAKLSKVGSRLNVIEGVNNCIVIADSYTSDFNSLNPAIDFTSRRMSAGMSLTVILSDVLHESVEDEELYENVAKLLEMKNVRRLIGIGRKISQYSYKFDFDAQFFDTTEDFLTEISQSDFEDEAILVKGAPEFGFDRIAEMLDARKHQTVLEVNLSAALHNYNVYKSLVPPSTGVICMVKASGYGAGTFELAKTLQDAGAAYLAVAVHDEGVDLRKAGIKMPIMVLNPNVVSCRSMFSYKLEPEVYSIEECRVIIHEAEKFGITDYPVHIKLDTGMHRLGFVKESLPELVELLRSQNAIKPVTVFSHLSVADYPTQDEYTQKQFDCFDECCEILQSGFTHRIYRHILNTAGIVRFPSRHYDFVRLGIGLYGAPATDELVEKKLQPVSSLYSVIISIKEWQAGTTIGYGRKGVLHRDSRIATIPIGYADGMDRHFGNGGANMYVNGTICPIIGNICMDMCMVDVTDADCKVGDQVEIFGRHISVMELARTQGTIPYEILTSIAPRVKRVHYRE